MYEVKKDAYSGVNIAKIPSMEKDELIENGDRLKNGSEEQIKAGLNLWMMALKKDPTDAELINKIASYQALSLYDNESAIDTYTTGIKAIEESGNVDQKELGNLYLGRAQFEIGKRVDNNYEQAKKDIETSADLTGKPIEESLLIDIEEKQARQERRKNKA